MRLSEGGMVEPDDQTAAEIDLGQLGERSSGTLFIAVQGRFM
jgi:hypothetical protein